MTTVVTEFAVNDRVFYVPNGVDDKGTVRAIKGDYIAVQWDDGDEDEFRPQDLGHAKEANKR